MYIDLIAWDAENDPDGNFQHIVGAGEVTAEFETDPMDPKRLSERTRRSLAALPPEKRAKAEAALGRIQRGSTRPSSAG